MTRPEQSRITIGVIGLGEAGRLIAADLAAAGAIVHGFDPAVVDASALEAAGVRVHTAPTDAVRDVDVVLSLNAGAAAVGAARSCLPALSPSVVYADANTGSPQLKQKLAELVRSSDARFVDVALMTPVPGSGLRTPMLAAGEGAGRFAELLGALGASVEVVGAVPGEAAAKQLLRSIYATSVAAGVIDALGAARALGKEEWLRGEIEADLGAAGRATVERMLAGTQQHAVRRQHEVRAAVEMLAEAGHELIVAPAVQRLMAEIAQGRSVTAPNDTAKHTVLRGIPYAADSANQVFDLYLPDSPALQPRPVVIAIHGGAFRWGDRSAELAALDQLIARGFAVASVEYRLSGEAVFPAAVTDVRAAVRHLRQHAANWNLDTERFVAWGRSAGGYLAAMLGVTGEEPVGHYAEPGSGVSSAVAAVVDWYGPSDFLSMDSQFRDNPLSHGVLPQLHDPADSPESLFLGAPIQTVPEIGRASSVLSYVSAAAPPFFLAAGDQDPLVPHQQTLALAAALTAAGVDVTMTIIADAGHAGTIFEEALTEPALEWLEQVLKR